ncbi:hypothetical protein Pmani_001990 [Petrolisthes manimaculis]|uniref:Uncharacterized protein n=1 Tax=Petrolisthes manimaculis TaxID=1843537 RepID=A0AAE1QIW8_9EUCA|nr:hypothetical protein Pmani_001990 [Petrolisthes manimaculis]
MVAYSEYHGRYSMECYGRTSARLFPWRGGPAFIADSTGVWGDPPYTLEEPPSPLMVLTGGGVLTLPVPERHLKDPRGAFGPRGGVQGLSWVERKGLAIHLY